VKEVSVGDVFFIGDERLLVVESGKCELCAGFDDDQLCAKLPWCSPLTRSDCKNVIFQEVIDEET